MDVAYLGLFDGFDYPHYPDYAAPEYRAMRDSTHFYAEPHGDRCFWVYRHTPLGSPGGSDQFIGNADYKVTRYSWTVEVLYPGERYARPLHATDEEPRRGRLALEAILDYARQQCPSDATLPVYLSSRWPSPRVLSCSAQASGTGVG